MGCFKNELSEDDPLDRQDTEAALVTCCSALLNFCVLEPSLVNGDFQKLANIVSVVFHTTGVDRHIVLSFNCITLVVMMLKSVDAEGKLQAYQIWHYTFRNVYSSSAKSSNMVRHAASRAPNLCFHGIKSKLFIIIL
jgi:hypothetical protein